MANLVRLDGDRVELPHLSLSYSITPPHANLQEGLAACQSLREDASYQALPLGQRREVSRFMGQFGGVLFRMLFPQGRAGELNTRHPLLLETVGEWQAYPWEWLNDGDRWWALGPGVVRFVTPPLPPAAPAPRRGAGLRALAVTANPLPRREDGEVFDHEARLGTRFINPVDGLFNGEGCDWEALEHASLGSLEQGLAEPPDLLYFNGFSGREGWFLESNLLRAERAGGEWLADRLGRAARQGLGLVVLNDSLGLLEPAAAGGQTAALIRAGVPGLIRMEGRHGRRREHDYLKVLTDQLSRGAPLHTAHLAGVRRLQRRSEASWDWSFFRLYLRAAPPNGATPQATPRDAAPAPAAAREESATWRGQRSAPPPPVFSARRRVFERRRVLEQLCRALAPRADEANPLVFLSGPAGSGKTVLALEAARRLQREFVQLAYFPARDAMPSHESLPATAAPEESPPPPAVALLGELIRQIQAWPLLEAPWESWQEGLQAHLAQGQPQLVIVDGLEGRTGYSDFCRILAGLPPSCRILLVSRAKPPLLAGSHIALEPLGREELGAVFDGALLKRIEASPLRGPLSDLCRSDLLAARLLWRLPAWPRPQAIGAALKEAQGEEASSQAAPGAGRLLSLLCGAVLEAIGREALAVLEALALFSYLAHRDALAALANVDQRALPHALAELQWLGLVDAFDGDRYFLLHPRLQAAVARRVMTPVVWRRLRTAWARNCQAWLAGLAGGGGQGAAPPGPPLTAWHPAQPGGRAARQGHRLGRERANLAELALALAEEGAWSDLARLADGARAVREIQGMDDVPYLINRLLAGVGGQPQWAALRATALNGVAFTLLRRNRPKAARPLLEGALDLLAGGEDWAPLAETYLLLGRCYQTLGRAEAASNIFFSAVELARQLDDTHFLVRAAEGLVGAWSGREDGVQQAERFLTDLLHNLEQGGRVQPAADLRSVLADLYLAENRSGEARELFQAVLHARRAAKAPQGMYRALLRLADCALAQGEPDDGLDLFFQARQCEGKRGDRAEETRVLEAMCGAFAAAGRLQDALEGYLYLKKILEEGGDRQGLIALLDTVGGLYFQLGEQAKSTRYYEESLQLKAAVIKT